MKCLVCQKEFKTITNTHLNSHNMTVIEYKNKYGVKTVYDGFCKGEKNGFFGKMHDENSKVKSDEYAKNVSVRLTGQTLEDRYGKEKATQMLEFRRERMLGELNPAWNGGIDSRGYSYKFLSYIRKDIVKLDKKCVLCGAIENLCAHHIDYDKLNDSYDNLITLCNSCNVKVNYNRDYWEEYFKSIIHNIRYDNPQPSQLNEEICRLEGSETRVMRNSTNNSLHECPMS